MLRRRLVLSYSSDEDEDEEPHYRPHPQHHEEAQFQEAPNPTNPLDPISPPNPNPAPNHSDPLEISDDEDFIDVSDNLSPPEPTSDDPPPTPNHFGCPVTDFLRGLGLSLKREWLDSCVQGLERSVPGFDDLGVAVKAKLCFEEFLLSDMNHSGGGVLPENVDSLHLVDLPGPYVLQVDEIVNISCPLKVRYQKAPPGIKRCLKLSMTDGVQRVFGMEYRPIKDLDALAPAGLKVVICNVHIRHGLLMLVPEAFEVLGGSVEELEAARQRLVDEVNKPPRGIRTRDRVVPPLRTRATLAAWPSNSAHVAGHSNHTTSEYTTPFQVQGATYIAPGTDTGQRTEEEFPGLISEESVIRNPSLNVDLGAEEFPVFVSEESAIPNPSSNVVAGAEDINMEFTSDGRANSVANPSSDFASAREEVDIDTLLNPSANVVTAAEEVHMDTIPNSRVNTVPNPSSDFASVGEEVDMETVPTSMANALSDPYLDDVSDSDEILMVDEVDHPIILSGVREVPFTYLASLSTKWAARRESSHSVRGIVKCFLTGVKSFQYKERTTYDLRVYVDDGSLISEILIDHDLVQKAIGHSPQGVTAALSSSDTTVVRNIKETMKQFQNFLANFEGKMLVEMNETSPLPVALEMKEGCPKTDARLLLRRLKSSVVPQTQRSLPMDPIDLSP